jgi:DNA polymerase-3 subunit gamma/tau
MLKTLEEPPEHVKFILATTDPQKLPVTVLSRCLQFNLKSLSPAALAGHLKHVLEAEGVAFEEPALAMLARSAAGSVRDSLSLADQAIAFGAGKITAAQVAQMLGAVGTDLMWPLLERVGAGDGPGALAEAERVGERSLSCDQALQDLAAILHRVALLQNGAAPAPDDPDAPRLRALAQSIEPGRVQVLYQIAILGRRDLSLAPDEFAGFTMAVMRMLSFASPAGAQARAGEAPDSFAARPQAVVAQAAAGISATPVPQAPAAPAEPIAFDGDWPAFVERLSLSGMAGLLARHGELVSCEGNHLQLVVPEAQKMYAEKAYQDKLKSELSTQFGQGFRLTVRVGPTRGASVAAARSVESQRRLESAAQAIEQDPFVRDLVREMGAQVVPSSIRPAGEAEPDRNDDRRRKP